MEIEVLYQQTRAFWKNRWSFVRSVTDGSQTNIKPSFSPTEAFAYFSDSFAKPANRTYKYLPHWVREVMPISRGEPEFDTNPISAEQIWRTLKKSNKSPAPSDDSITYHHLWKLPSTHALLATIFNNIFES